MTTPSTLRPVALGAAMMLGTVLPPDGAPPPAAASTSPAPVTATVTTALARLSLTLPAARVAPNALVLATVRLTNLSGRAMTTWDCPAASLGAEVDTAGGRAAYPPPGAPWTDCVGAVAQTRPVRVLHLPPGRTVVRRTYIMLRTMSVRARAELRVAPVGGKPVVIVTPLLHLRPRHASGPRLRLVLRPRVHVDVLPVPGAGRILYSQFAHCGDVAHAQHAFKTTAPFSRWVPSRARVIRPFGAPRCDSLVEWDLFVAQPDHPVAHVYFCPRRDMCVYTPLNTRPTGVTACKRNVARAIQMGRLPATPAAARYAVGLTSTPPSGLTPRQQALAQAFHDRCYPLLHAPTAGR